jgi:hypothetical protein
MYVGAVCDQCYENTPFEFRLSTISSHVASRFLEARKYSKIMQPNTVSIALKRLAFDLEHSENPSKSHTINYLRKIIASISS